MYNKVTLVLCVYVHFFTLFFIMVWQRILTIIPCYIYDLVVYSMYNSLYLLTWNPTPSLSSSFFSSWPKVCSLKFVSLFRESSHLPPLSTENRPLLYGVQASHIQRLVIFSLIPMTVAWHMLWCLSCPSAHVGLCICAELAGIPGPWFLSKGATFLWKWSLWKDWLSHCLRFWVFSLNISHGRDLCFRLANCFLDSVLHVLNINTWIDVYCPLRKILHVPFYGGRMSQKQPIPQLPFVHPKH